MKTNNLYFLIFASIFSYSAFAQPMLNANCFIRKQLRLPKNSSGYFMSNDCKTVYVLPPEHGSIEIDSISSFGLQSCRSIKDVRRNLSEIQKILTSVTDPTPKEPRSSGGLGDYRRPTTEDDIELSDEQIEQLINKQKLAEDILRGYSSQHGATISLLYSTGYSDLINDFRVLNQNAGVQFVQMPLKNSKFRFRSVEMNNVDPVLGSSFSVEDAMGMNGSLSGYVDLSLIGACPLLRPGQSQISSNLKAEKVAANLTANVSFEYDLLSTVSYMAKVNRGALAKQIRNVSSRGGLFKTSTVSKLINTTRSNSWFEYSYKCDDTRACEAAHDINVLEIKKRLMDEVLSNIVLAKSDYLIPVMESGTPSENGATVAGQELKKCSHKYCQIAAGVLNVANALGGGTSKTDQYIKEEDHWASEEFTEQKALSFQGTMGFAARD